MRKRTKRKIYHGFWILMILTFTIATYVSFILVENLLIALLFFSLFILVSFIYRFINKEKIK